MHCFRSAWISILTEMVTPKLSPTRRNSSPRQHLSDVTDPLDPVPLGGNLLLQMRSTDNGEPGENDTIGFTLWDDGTLLFSSHRNGPQSVEQSVAGGNLQVH